MSDLGMRLSQCPRCGAAVGTQGGKPALCWRCATTRPNGNREHDIAIYVAQYRKLTTDDLRIMLHSGTHRRGNTPWQREAIRKVLRERGE